MAVQQLLVDLVALLHPRLQWDPGLFATSPISLEKLFLDALSPRSTVTDLGLTSRSGSRTWRYTWPTQHFFFLSQAEAWKGEK